MKRMIVDKIKVSRMGIRVDSESLLIQLEIKGEEDNVGLNFHRRLLEGKLPLTIGGGIGQSRLCMLYFRKAHIGEVQASVWPDTILKRCKKNNIFLLRRAILKLCFNDIEKDE